ncbi:MAG: hypothetical protein AB8B51_13325 [Sedimentitalea sp.]
MIASPVSRPVIFGAAAVAMAMVFSAPAMAGSKAKTDTPQVSQAATTTKTRASNWPNIPERHAGKSYSAVIKDGFGARERNFESGRR